MVSVYFISLALAALAALGVAAPVDIEKRDSHLKVTLAATAENAVVEATITNTGSTDLTVLKLGSILADSPIKKVKVLSGDSELEFKGIKLRYKTKDLGVDAFTTIAAGQSVKTNVELAGLYDLSSASNIKVVASGAFKYTDNERISASSVSSTTARVDAKDTGRVEFESNTLELAVDSQAAAKRGILEESLTKRIVKSGCSSSESSALTTALSTASTRARSAASAAKSGYSTLFYNIFGDTSSSARSEVSARFTAVASVASSSSSSFTYYCDDPYGYCDSNTLAWTLPSTNVIANCPIYYSELPASATACFDQDKWSTTTSYPAVYSPGTDDYAYGYSEIIQLPAEYSLENADSYALFAQGVYLGCQGTT